MVVVVVVEKGVFMFGKEYVTLSLLVLLVLVAVVCGGDVSLRLVVDTVVVSVLGCGEGEMCVGFVEGKGVT